VAVGEKAERERERDAFVYERVQRKNDRYGRSKAIFTKRNICDLEKGEKGINNISHSCLSNFVEVKTEKLIVAERGGREREKAKAREREREI